MFLYQRLFQSRNVSTTQHSTDDNQGTGLTDTGLPRSSIVLRLTEEECLVLSNATLPTNTLSSAAVAPPAQRRVSVEEAPRSRSLQPQLPLTLPLGMNVSSTFTVPSANGGKHNTTGGVTTPDPVLLHPILHKLPLQVRFVCNGLLSNVLFVVAYNVAVRALAHLAPSIIYLYVYFVFIPLGHFMASLLVFGWPERYLQSMISNCPIGLTAMTLGGALTAFLDRVEFNARIEEFIWDNFTFTNMPPRTAHDKRAEFYSSLLVLIVTSIWTYILSVYVNGSASSISSKKEL